MLHASGAETPECNWGEGQCDHGHYRTAGYFSSSMHVKEIIFCNTFEAIFPGFALHCMYLKFLFPALRYHASMPC